VSDVIGVPRIYVGGATLASAARLTAAGFGTGESETPITPIMVGEAKTAHAFSRALFEEGVFATGIGYPTVPEGKARIRTIMTATHTREQLDRALEILTRVAQFGPIPTQQAAKGRSDESMWPAGTAISQSINPASNPFVPHATGTPSPKV
jgi:hypothetical protein